MLNEPTMDRLRALNLGAMAEAWQAQQKDTRATELDFDTRFACRACSRSWRSRTPTAPTRACSPSSPR